MPATPDLATHVLLAATNAAAISTGSANLSLTFFTIPRFLELPSPLNVRRWLSMFDVTKWALGLPMGLTGMAYLGLAARLRHHPDSALSGLLAFAGTLCLGVVPYTKIVVMPTINRLKARWAAAQDVPDGKLVNEKDGDNQSTHALIRKWGRLSVGRGILMMAAAVIGMGVALNLGFNDSPGGWPIELLDA